MDEPRPPGPLMIERAVSAWQRLQSAILFDPTLDDDETRIAEALDVELDAPSPTKLIARLVEAITWAELRRVEARGLAAIMSARAKRYVGRIETMRMTLHGLLDILGRKKIATPWGTAYLRDVAESVVIIDLEALPAEYVTERTVREPKTDALLADLREGVVITGAVLSNASTTVAIRKPKRADSDETEDE